MAELRGRAEAEKEGLKAAVDAADARTAAVQGSVARLESELQSYKVRLQTCSLHPAAKINSLSCGLSACFDSPQDGQHTV